MFIADDHFSQISKELQQCAIDKFVERVQATFRDVGKGKQLTSVNL
jgi:hypothetical protein